MLCMILIVGRVLDRRYLHSRSIEQPGTSAVVLPRRGARAAQERGGYIPHVHPHTSEAQLHLIVDHFDKPVDSFKQRDEAASGPDEWWNNQTPDCSELNKGDRPSWAFLATDWRSPHAKHMQSTVA